MREMEHVLLARTVSTILVYLVFGTLGIRRRHHYNFVASRPVTCSQSSRNS